MWVEWWELGGGVRGIAGCGLNASIRVGWVNCWSWVECLWVECWELGWVGGIAGCRLNAGITGLKLNAGGR